jgi:hypothetical protein
MLCLTLSSWAQRLMVGFNGGYGLRVRPVPGGEMCFSMVVSGLATHSSNLTAPVPHRRVAR